LFNEIDLERDRETVYRDYRRGVESVAGVHKISNYSPVTSADMQAGHTVVNRDSQTDARTAEFYEQTYAPVGERAYIAVPLLRENHWVASLWVSDNEPRNWSDTEISLLETVGERAWLAVEKLRNETALRESEESYRILAETASDAIIRIDQNSTIEFVNTATERIFGYAPKEMVGQSLTMLMPEEMRQKHRAGFGRYLTTGKRNLRWESIEVPARHKDGHHFPLEISFGEYNRDGKRFFIGVARDISERRQAEKLLRESEERFAKAFNSSPLSITITSLDTGKLIEVNETFVEITGYSREEAIGRTTAELGLWQPNVRDAELETIKRKGQISNTEYQFRLKDGTEIVGLLSAELLEIGGEPCALTVIQDITTRKRAEELIRESEEKFRNLANSISQFAWMADASGYIFWFNERWFEYTGTTLEEMQGWDWQKVHHPAEVERVIVKFKRHIASGEIWEDTFPLRSKTGKYRWFLSRALPIRNEHGNIVRWFGTNTDIEEVRQARLQAEAANRLKDEFLATVSHELRTPLNAILGWSNMIQTGKANDETKIRANEIIYLNAKSQAALIEDLLDVSSIITGKMKLEPHPVKFALVVESAIDTIRSAADAKSIELETNIECEPCIIGGDAQRLQQVVWNLISNAVKFTPEGGKIAVKLENGNSRARLTIKDSGKGIEAEFLPYIFERFRQEDASSTRRHGGLGLGLAIVRHLVELHGGTISAMSAGENLGSTFTIELPLI
nr:PAS domain S-box protein [Acidobacteriota bacterium]